jgi:hypothetical protein
MKNMEIINLVLKEALKIYSSEKIELLWQQRNRSLQKIPKVSSRGVCHRHPFGAAELFKTED